MTGVAGKQRVLVLFSVLAGLFLMHGITGGGTGCHGMSPAAMAMTSAGSPMWPGPAGSTWSGSAGLTGSAHGAPMHSAIHDEPAMLVPAQPKPGHAQAGETCVPLRPESWAGLFLLAFLIAITAWRPRLPHGTKLVRPHWPHGPPRTGVQVLHQLSISRT
ncbi:hypothetical protein [Catenulispora subtropica]|uniref:Secreted protein n=1 Tax=Catenulispora subtropica TaxID=450798 RepID=A0ABN2T9S1_9ACTN